VVFEKVQCNKKQNHIFKMPVAIISDL